jgi:DNA polymerase III alpha subunit
MKSKIFPLFPSIQNLEKKIGFDIYDYRMIFSDEETKRIIREGKTIGCFYIESPGMRSLLKKMKSDTFEMLTAISSVIRPGVAESGMMQEFIVRHHDPSKRKYLVPELEPLLKETYGVMIYQEDVIKVAHYVAGLSLEEADLLRRAMSGKMRSHEAMRKLKDKFFDHCLKKYSEEVTAELWRQIESFAGYAFCKAHSASFALLSFQNAFLKAHYPAEFMSSILTNQGGYYSPAVYVQESKRLGLKILLPDINESEIEYTGKNDWIRIGLMAIKNLSHSSMEKIVDERKKNGKYKSLRDFVQRTGIGYAECSILIQCGAMDCFAEQIYNSLKRLDLSNHMKFYHKLEFISGSQKRNKDRLTEDSFVLYARPLLMRMLDIELHRKKLKSDATINLFEDDKYIEELLKITGISNVRKYSIAQICKIEYETFGYMVSRHPLEFYSKFVNDPSVTPSEELPLNKGKRVKVIGWLMTSKRIRTRKGDIMKFLSLEDLTGTFEAVIFPKEYEKYAPYTLSMGPYLIEGYVDNELGDTVTVKKLSVINSRIALRMNQIDDAENVYKNTEKTLDEEFRMIEDIADDMMFKQLVNF